MGSGVVVGSGDTVFAEQPIETKVTVDDVIEIFAKAFQKKLSIKETQLVDQYYVESAPEIIFKYRPMVYAFEFEAIKANKIWFSELSTLNDPFEAYAVINCDKFATSVINSDSDLKKMLKGKPYVHQMQARKAAIMEIKSRSQEFLEGMRSDLSISCFSERNNSILMWGHYANMHRGICVAYNVLEMSKGKKVVIPVNYTEQLPSLAEYSNDGLSKFLIETVRTKAKDWSYEREWRCIQDKGACGDSWRGNGALLDVAEPKAIYLGCRSSAEQIAQMKEICFNTHKIPLYIMEQSQTEYEMHPIEIT